MDAEVARLRQLRDVALRARAVARSLRWAVPDPIIERSGAAAWRVARAVTGRLRSHPYVRYQRDATVGVVLMNAIVAGYAGWRVPSRVWALRRLAAELHGLRRELDDARVLTRAADFSDSLGRSQHELAALKHAIDRELEDPAATPCEVQDGAPRRAADWPYLAFQRTDRPA
jgi:hypothetical protein